MLLVAALAVLLLLRTDRFGYPEVPALVGLGYLAGAVAGGPSDALWAPALVVSGWGLGNVALGWSWVADLGTPQSAAHLVGTGLGVLGLAGLGRLGVVVDAAGVGLALVLSGVLFTVQRGQQPEALTRDEGAVAYAGLLAAFGIVELARAAVRHRAT